MRDFELHIIKQIDVAYLRSGKENEEAHKEHCRTLEESHVDLHVLEVLQLGAPGIAHLLHSPAVHYIR